MLRFIAVFKKYFGKISYSLAAIVIIVLTTLSFFQLIYRHVMGNSLIWMPDVTYFCVTTCIALTLPPLWLDNNHLTMDLISGKLSEKGNFLLSCFIDIVCMGMAVVIAYSGYMDVKAHIGYVTSILKYDDALKYVFVLYLGVMLAFSILCSFIQRVIQYRNGGEASDK